MVKKWAPVRGGPHSPFLPIMTEAIKARIRVFPMTYKIGTIGEFRKWTMLMVKDPAAAANTTKRWFDSEETAAKAMGKQSIKVATAPILNCQTCPLPKCYELPHKAEL